MNNFKEPYYLVDFSSSICNFEVFINGMPAFVHNEGGSISSHAPINHFILESGIQNIEINVTPLKGETNLREDAFIKIKVFCYDSATTNYDDTIIVFNFEKLDFFENNLSIINLSNEFKAEVKYNIDGWKNSALLKDILDEEQILKYLKTLHTAFKNKNINFLYEEMKFKFEEVDISMYLGLVNNKKELSQLFTTLKSGAFQLQDFPSSCNLKLFADNKVCSLFRDDNLPIIFYTNYETNEEFSFPIFVHKRDSSFGIIR